MRSETRIITATALFGTILLAPSLAQAYLGPGLGAGTIAIVLGVLGSVFLAIFGVLWYPIKRWRKRRREARERNDKP